MTRRKDGLWQERVKIGDKARYFYGRTKAEVLRKIREAEEDRIRGAEMQMIFDLWWSKHEPTLEYNTLRSYTPAVERAKTYFTGVDVKKLRPVDIGRFLDHMIDENDWAEKTAKTQLLVVNLALRWAVMEGYIDVNPCADIRVPKGLKKGFREPPSDDDLRKIKANLHSPHGFFAYFILYTGLRDGEAKALTWRDVDLKKREITVSKSVYHVGNQPRIKTPKTSAGVRKVPILDALLPHLKPGNPNEYVFPGKNGKPMTQSQFEDDWNKYREETGVECTPHQIRHGYATMLYESGLSTWNAHTLMGHAQEATTSNIYAHIREIAAKKQREDLYGIDIDV